MDRVFLSYCNADALPQVTRAQAKKLTHLCIAFAVPNSQGYMSIDSFRHWMPYVKAIQEYNPKLNILLSTGGGGEVMALFTGKDIDGQMRHNLATSTPEGVKRLADSCIAIVREFQLDGIDCDWEIPCITGNMDEKFQYTALLEAYRQRLDEYERQRGRKCWLTAAWIASGAFVRHAVELDKLLPIMDFINVMTYDMEGSGGALEGFFKNPGKYTKNGRMDFASMPRPQARTGHHSNVYPTAANPASMCCQEAVNAYREAGVPSEKIVLGAAFYSKQSNAAQAGQTHGLHQSAGFNSNWGAGYAALRQAYETNPDYTKYWDDEAQACWLYNGYNFITYEDPRAIKTKAEFVKKENLRGIMYWEHHSDPSCTLFNAIYDNIFL